MDPGRLVPHPRVATMGHTQLVRPGHSLRLHVDYYLVWDVGTRELPQLVRVLPKMVPPRGTQS